MFEQAFRNIDDVLRKEAGCTTELDYTEQTSWLLFLKYLDALEQEKATEAALPGSIQQGHVQDALTFPCLSVGVQMRFGAACKSLGALSLVRDYILAFPPIFRLVPNRIDLRVLVR